MIERTRFRRACRRAGLTDREADALEQLARGRSIPEAADALGLSSQTVANHLNIARRVLKVATTDEALAAIRRTTLLVEMEHPG